MGYAIAFSPCLCCQQMFGYNPVSVPSHSGEPVCRRCMTIINHKREAGGLLPFPILADAYEPVDEAEL